MTIFSCLIAVARTSDTMLNRSGESGHSCLLPEFSGKAFSFSPFGLLKNFACIFIKDIGLYCMCVCVCVCVINKVSLSFLC